MRPCCNISHTSMVRRWPVPAQYRHQTVAEMHDGTHTALVNLDRPSPGIRNGTQCTQDEALLDGGQFTCWPGLTPAPSSTTGQKSSAAPVHQYDVRVCPGSVQSRRPRLLRLEADGRQGAAATRGVSDAVGEPRRSTTARPGRAAETAPRFRELGALRRIAPSFSRTLGVRRSPLEGGYKRFAVAKRAVHETSWAL